MMKTVAFLLLLSSTNAARSDGVVIPFATVGEMNTEDHVTEDNGDWKGGESQTEDPVVLDVTEEIRVDKNVDAVDVTNLTEEKQNLWGKIRGVMGKTTTCVGEWCKKKASAVKNAATNVGKGIKVRGNSLTERSSELVRLVREFRARAIVAAVVLAISWVVVPWFIVRQIVEFITSKPKAGVISALITMFVAIPAALVAVLLHENTFNKVVKFLGQPFFGTQENTQIVEEVMVNENDVPNTN